MGTITTTQGDTWDILSKKYYGSEMYMDKLINANIEYRKTLIFSANIVLNAPDIDVENTTINEDLPIWKREVTL